VRKVAEKGYYIYDRIIAQDKQTVFNTSKPFISGTLLVYLNGLLVRMGTDLDYIEVDVTTIKFNYELEANDEVIIASLFASNNYAIDVVTSNPNNRNAIHYKYSSSVKLKNNQRYTVNIALKNQNVSWSFVSKLNPLYINVDKIRMDTGDLLDGASDEEILRVLYTNSKECKLHKDVYDSENTSSTDTDSVSIANAANKLKQWVRYKTDIDIVNSIYLSLCGLSGSAVKRIGDLSIQKDVTLPALKNMLERFRELFKIYESIFDSDPTLVQYFVKASNNATYTSRGTF
jgi:hypothetical protein